jgi:hypothetical protein
MVQQMHVTVLEFIAQELARITNWWLMCNVTKIKLLLAVRMLTQFGLFTNAISIMYEFVVLLVQLHLSVQ